MKWFKWALIAAIVSLAAMPAWSQRVLVFPFEQTAGPSSGDWIGTGLAVALNEGLTRGGVPHISYSALQRLYDQEGLVQSPGFALPAQIGLANQLGTGTLVRGSYQLDDNGLRVHLEAFDVKGNLERLGQWDESANLSGLLELTDKLGQDLFRRSRKDVESSRRRSRLRRSRAISGGVSRATRPSRRSITGRPWSSIPTTTTPSVSSPCS